MKKTTFAVAAAAVLAAVCIASLSGCRKANMEQYTPTTTLTADDQLSGVAAKLVDSCGFTDNMTEQDIEAIPLFFGFSSSAASGNLYCGESSNQLLTVLKAADGMEVRLERTLITYIKRRISSSEDADAKAMMEKYVLKSGGGYVILAVSSDADAAEAAVSSAMAELGVN